MKDLLILSGFPRSGTTWAAGIIGQSPSVNYISGEPLNPPFSKKSFGLNISKWYPYFTDQDSFQGINQLNNAFCLCWSREDSIRRLKYILNESPTHVKLYLRGMKHYFFSLNLKLNFVKDPALFLSLENLYNHIHPRILIMYRNPSAVVHSMLRVHWSLYFEALLNQKNLVEDHLLPFEEQMKYYVGKPLEHDQVGRIILFWKIYYTLALKWLKKYNKDWFLVSHEQLALDPVSEFSRLLELLNLEATKKIKIKLNRSLGYKNRVASKDKVHDLNRNSAGTVSTWEIDLEKRIIDRIEKETEDIYNSLKKFNSK